MPGPDKPRRRDLAIVAAFTVLAALPFLGSAFHIDEPFFLALARQILKHPLRPADFQFNWLGRLEPMARGNTHSTLVPYLLAPILGLTGGREWATRLCALPFDVAAALGLYSIAARFLKRPLLPALIVLSSPAYLINTQHLMSEKWVEAFGYPGLFAWLSWADGEGERRGWAASALFALALLAKYSAAFLLVPAAGYALHRGLGPRRIAARLAAALAPVAAYLAWGVLFQPSRAGSVWALALGSASAPWMSWPYKLRSLLAFTGGCGAAAAVWPRWRSGGGQAAWPAAAAAALLFSPVFDAGTMSILDRLTGTFFSTAALLGLAALCRRESRESAGWALWAPWTLSVLVLSAGFYWSIVSRFILFLVPPVAFATAASLESRLESGALGRLYAANLASVLSLSLALASVDARYAGAQKLLAERVRSRFLSGGKKVWFTGHWGLQYYMEKAGAAGLDIGTGAWAAVRPGDVVVVPTVNANILPPPKPLPARVTTLTLDDPIPLRLMGTEAGFYSNAWGVLPFSLSREPLDVVRVFELR